MMMQIERASSRIFKYTAYVIAVVLGVLLAFLNVRGKAGSSTQLFGDGMSLGSTAHADAPVVDTGCGDGGVGSSDGGGSGTAGGCTGGADGTGDGSGGGTGGTQ